MHAAKRVVLVAASCLVTAATALAQSPLNASVSMNDNLMAVSTSKKVVTVVLKNGDSYRAKIGAVGDHHVLLTEPYQKEFFDVLVPIDEITALEVRAREP
jgi:hypothetical protein